VVIFRLGADAGAFWVELDELDLKPAPRARNWNWAGGKTYSGNAVGQFVDASCLPSRSTSPTDLAPGE